MYALVTYFGGPRSPEVLASYERADRERVRTTDLRTGRWEFRATLSSAGFAVRNFGLKTVHGQVPIREASVVVARDGDITAVRAGLDLAGIDTGNSRRDTDLRKPHLLGTVKYPDLTFTARTVERIGDGWRVLGDIEACGARTPVALHAIVTGHAGSPDLTVHASAEFDRRALGIRAPRVLIGRRIRVSIDAVFTPAD